jgi:DNA-binding GntR family transcriptional regulator
LRIGVLSKALAVSPTPVREALARLAAAGLIAHEARKGYRIAPPLTFEQLKELMDARRLIEVGAIGHACRNGGAAFRSDLAAALEAQSAAVEALNAANPADRAERVALEWRVLEADLRFHQVIFDRQFSPVNFRTAEICDYQTGTRGIRHPDTFRGRMSEAPENKGCQPQLRWDHTSRWARRRSRLPAPRSPETFGFLNPVST